MCYRPCSRCLYAAGFDDTAAVRGDGSAAAFCQCVWSCYGVTLMLHSVLLPLLLLLRLAVANKLLMLLVPFLGKWTYARMHEQV